MISNGAFENLSFKDYIECKKHRGRGETAGRLPDDTFFLKDGGMKYVRFYKRLNVTKRNKGSEVAESHDRSQTGDTRLVEERWEGFIKYFRFSQRILLKHVVGYLN